MVRVSEANGEGLVGPTVAVQMVLLRLLKECRLSAEAVMKYAVFFWQHGLLTQEVFNDLDVKSLSYPRKELQNSADDALVLPSPFLTRCFEPEFEPDPPPCSSRFKEEFEHLALLGRGAFGEVWHVRSRVDQREYAVKVVPFEYSHKGGHLDHPALREARAWAAVDHPNAVRYHAAWVEVGQGQGAASVPVVGDGYPLPFPPAGAPTVEQEHDSEQTALTFTDGTEESDGGVVFENSHNGPDAETSQDDHAEESGSEGSIFTPEAGHEQDELQIVGKGYFKISGMPSPLGPRRVNASPTMKKRHATLYVQTELVRGGNLQEWIKKRNEAVASERTSAQEREKWLTHGEAIFRQLVSVIDALHTRNIVHRDIKPANVLLAEDGSVRLGDFGLATLITDNQHDAEAIATVQPATTAPELLEDTSCPHTRGVGTPSYASPEQMQEEKYTAKVDVYSLGIVLAELLFPVQTAHERALLLEALRCERRLPALEDHEDGLYTSGATLAVAMTNAAPRERPSMSDLQKIMTAETDGGIMPVPTQALPSTSTLPAPRFPCVRFVREHRRCPRLTHALS